MKYEFLEHTAEIKFRTFGMTLGGAFENAVLAFSEFVSRGKKIKSVESRALKVEGDDLNSLLYKFLEELIYLLDAENFAVSRAKIKADEKNFSLTAELFGDNAGKYEGLDNAKAVTYSDMFVRRKSSGRGWELQVVIDV
ncbi:MAG: archease [Patescibacteria group bacterium]